MDYPGMEEVSKKCLEIAMKTWTEQTKSNGNFSEADKLAISKLATTMLEYFLKTGIPLEKA